MRTIIECEPEHLQEGARIAVKFIESGAKDTLWTVCAEMPDGEVVWSRDWWCRKTKSGVSVRL